MNTSDVGDILYQTIALILKLSTPLLLVALIVGVVVSLIQALLQVQEQTLTFVPKLFAICAALIFLSGFMNQNLIRFTQQLFSRIVAQ